jgi:hypothetical protein
MSRAMPSFAHRARVGNLPYEKLLSTGSVLFELAFFGFSAVEAGHDAQASASTYTELK